MDCVQLHILPADRVISAPAGRNLLAALRDAGAAPEAPCGGRGQCGKCRVRLDGTEVLACQVTLERDAAVELQPRAEAAILTTGISGGEAAGARGLAAAFDIGTTTVVCYLLDRADGRVLAATSMRSPQAAYGADVISRIQAALHGALAQLGSLIRDGMTELLQKACAEAGRDAAEIAEVCVVGNPAMQQLFLGISPQNLATIPFAPALREAKTVPAAAYLPVCADAALQIVPDISDYVGADTLACVLATKLHQAEELTLLVDIGTNGEMVLGSCRGMVACSTAAGPALEGAGICCGMCGGPGAIDHVWIEDGALRCSVIGGGRAQGICGSGLIDAVAALLELGRLDRRGRILDGTEQVALRDGVYLTQEDIRAVQLAKGAIAAGIELMAAAMGVEVSAIRRVLLAGAFGTYLRPESACRIGLLPPMLLERIEAVGNAAGSGAQRLVCDPTLLPETQGLCEEIQFLELAEQPAFRRAFAKNMML